jgi:protein involved in polysaccharide export with SLBB domain
MVALCASVGTLAVGCASASPQAPAAVAPKPPVPAEVVEDRHNLAIGDVISIEFPHRGEFNQEVILRTDGRIALPLIGPIPAAGSTPEELEAELRRRYAALSYDPAGGSDEKHYVINIDDVLDIHFRDVPNLNATVQVRPDGRISLDLVKSIVAEGKTPEQLEAELIQQYSRFLQNPDLVVIVKQYTSDLVSLNGRLTRPGLKNLDDATVMIRSYSPRQVYVTGEVRAPGFVTFRPPLTAMQAIISSGGLLNTAAGGRIVLLRKTGLEPPTVTFLDLNADLHGEGSNDVPLRAFDIVVVPKSKIASINQFLDQYVYQLVPAARNVNFTFFYELSGNRVP